MFNQKWWPAAALMIVLSACGTATSTSTALPSSVPTEPPVPSPTATPLSELVLIADSELAWESDLKAWAAQRGWELTLADPSGAAAYLRETQSQVQAVVSIHETLGGDLQQAAAAGIPVVIIEAPGVDPGPSLSVVGTARHDQAGFLAGVMTGLTSQTGWVGQVTATGGLYEADYSAGFTQGLLWGCPKCRLISQTAAEMTVDGFRGKGVDVVFPFPGSEAAKAIEALANAELPIVWVGDGGPAGEMLIGRIAFQEGLAVIIVLEELMATGDGQFRRPSIETSSIVLVDINSELLSIGRQRLLDKAHEAIAAGELDIGTDPDS